MKSKVIDEIISVEGEAERIVKNAEREAEEIIESARGEAERIIKEAVETERREGEERVKRLVKGKKREKAEDEGKEAQEVIIKESAVLRVVDLLSGKGNI